MSSMMFDRSIQRGSPLRGVFEDDIGESVVDQMLDISKFAYLFAAQPKDQNRLLKYPITVSALAKFIKLNQ